MAINLVHGKSVQMQDVCEGPSKREDASFRRGFVFVLMGVALLQIWTGILACAIRNSCCLRLPGSIQCHQTESKSRYDGYVLDIPLSNGIEEFISGIKTAATRSGTDLLLIQVGGGGVSLPLKCCMWCNSTLDKGTEYRIYNTSVMIAPPAFKGRGGHN